MTAATEPAIVRRVDHVMGLPISLALRGRHTSDTALDGSFHDSGHDARHRTGHDPRYRSRRRAARTGNNSRHDGLGPG